jgi:hypothetical protein
VKREGISEAMRPGEVGSESPDLEFQPIALFQVVNTAVECQKEFEGMVVSYVYPVRI